MGELPWSFHVAWQLSDMFAGWTGYTIRQFGQDPRAHLVPHPDVAQAVIETLGEDKTGPNFQLLTPALVQELEVLGEAIGVLEPADPEKVGDRPETAGRLVPVAQVPDKPIIDDMTWPDAAFVSHLAAQLDDPETMRAHRGGRIGRRLRRDRRELLAESLERALRFWGVVPTRRFTRPKDGPPEALLMLAGAVWDRVSSERDAAKPALMHVQGTDGDQYAQAPKALAPIAWAFGGAGEATLLDSTGSRIELDGDEYASTPAIARNLHRGVAFMPQGKRPQQLAFPVDLRTPLAGPFVLRAVQDTRHVVSTHASKALVYCLLTGRPDGQLVKATVGEIAQTLNPGRRIQKRDVETTIRALRELRSVGLVMPDGTDFALFDIRAPQGLDRQAEARWAYTANARVGLRELGADRAFKGNFLINFSGLMRLNGRQGLELRGYLNSCASWNDARRGRGVFNAKHMKALTHDEWAAVLNALSGEALDYLREHDQKKRRGLSEDRRRVNRAFETLEAQGLVVMEKTGRGRYRPMPPEALLEAWELMRKQGARENG